MLAYSRYALMSNNTENSDFSSFEAFTSSSSSSFDLDTKSSSKEELYSHLYNDTFNFDSNFNFKDKSPLLLPLKEASTKALAKSFALLVKKEHSLVARA
jgi:hypothetical protein